jgi:hypothetical protein
MAHARTGPAWSRIHAIRKAKVVVDADLAALDGVPMKRLNQAVTRNALRFPGDFRFVPTVEEGATLRSEGEEGVRSPSAILETDSRGRHRNYRPRGFTEHGALMVANGRRSERAAE